MQLDKPSTLHGFLLIAATTMVAIIVVKPIIEQVSQSIFHKTAENVISFGRAA